MNNTQPFYRFRAEAGPNGTDEPASAELLIFSVIGDWEDMGEVGASAFAADLAKLPSSVKRLDIHINSPGGSVSEANGIYSRLADHRSQKIVYVDGMAASAASIIAMVGHKIYIRANANMMIHLPSAIALGNADDMRTVAAALDSVTESMINVYARRTKLDRDEIRSLLTAETWFSPQQAVDKGFADEVRGVVKTAAVAGTKRVIVNGIEHDLSRFHNVPAVFTATTQPNNMANQPAPAAPPANQPPPAPPNQPPHDPPAPPAPPAQPPAPAANPPANTPPPPNTAPAGAPPPPAPGTHEAGVQAERTRVTALQAMDRPATHDIITAAIKDGKQPADVVADCMAAMDKAGTQNNRRTDASVLNGIPGSEAGNGTTNPEAEAFGKTLKEKVKARAKSVRPNYSRN